MESIPLTADFRDILELLNSEKVEYMVVGAYAVGHHGYVRSTGDLDIWVRRSTENVERLVKVLCKFGFSEQTVPNELFLGKKTAFLIGNIPDRIDILTRLSAVDFDECFQRRVQGNFDGVPVDVIGLDDLKTNKKAAGRHKDLGDVDGLP